MYLTSVSKLKLNKQQFKIIDAMSYRAKALYNSSLYEVNKHFQNTKKYLNYNNTDLLMKNHLENTVYRSLPAQVSQQLIKKLHKDYSSFFSLLKKKQNKDYDKQIDTPNFKSKDSRITNDIKYVEDLLNTYELREKTNDIKDYIEKSKKY